VGKINGAERATMELATTGMPVKINASCPDKIIKAGQRDITHLYVTLCDDNGNTVYTASDEITCEVSGPAEIIGMEDSNPSNTEDYKDNKQHAYHGKLLIYLQSTDNAGKIGIRLTSPGLKETFLELASEK